MAPILSKACKPVLLMGDCLLLLLEFGIWFSFGGSGFRVFLRGVLGVWGFGVLRFGVFSLGA